MIFKFVIAVQRKVLARVINDLYLKAIKLRDDRDNLSMQVTWYDKLVKARVCNDKVGRIVNTSKDFVCQVDFGLSVGFHRTIKPFKRKAIVARLLLERRRSLMRG